MRDGYGNDGLWTRRKTKSRFPSAPTALGNRRSGDFHIPTAAAVYAPIKVKSKIKKNCVRWKSGNPKPGFPLSHRTDGLRRKEGDCVVDSGTRLEARTSERRPYGGRFAPASRLIVQLENAVGGAQLALLYRDDKTLKHSRLLLSVTKKVVEFRLFERPVFRTFSKCHLTMAEDDPFWPGRTHSS